MSDIDFSNGNAQTNGEADNAGPATPGNAVSADNGQGNQGGQDQGFIEYGGRKFSGEDVLKKLENADSFIEQLKSEREADRAKFAALEEQLSKLGKVDSVLEALQGKSQGEPAPETGGDGSENEQGLDPEALAAQIQERVLAGLNEKTQAETQANNWKQVTNTLTHHYGEKVNAKVAEIAAEHDLTLTEAKEMAQSRPKVFLNLFGLRNSGS